MVSKLLRMRRLMTNSTESSLHVGSHLSLQRGAATGMSS
jgi:hypothetical protein